MSKKVIPVLALAAGLGTFVGMIFSGHPITGMIAGALAGILVEEIGVMISNKGD